MLSSYNILKKGTIKMKIIELFNSKKTVISFEVFPPKPELPLDTIFNTIENLQNLHPDFISVTYGAGGGIRSRSADIASKIKNSYNIEALSHLTCITSTTQDINNILQLLRNENIENILALRGDIPKDTSIITPANIGFRYASDLISYIKNTDDICIGAACYPEGHIQMIDKKDDIQNLKLKVDSGVDFLVSQLFFDNNILYSFLEDIRNCGINCPVSAGIMPVFSANLIKKLTIMCGATIPKKLIKILNKYESNPEDLTKAGIAYAITQIQDLIANGIQGIHLYTMNKSDHMQEIMKNVLS